MSAMESAFARVRLRTVRTPDWLSREKRTAMIFQVLLSAYGRCGRLDSSDQSAPAG